MIPRLSFTALLTLGGIVWHPLLSSGQTDHTGAIGGVIVNERQEPVRGATVVAFKAGATLRSTNTDPRLFDVPESGSASTNAAGRFEIATLPPGEYLIAALANGFVTGPTSGRLYGLTCFPSTLDVQKAVQVSALKGQETTIRLQLVPVRGVRVSGSVASPSGQSAAGMSVSLYRRFGGFGEGQAVATVDARGAFQISGLAPGRYWLTIQRPRGGAGDDGGGFAGRMIEVRDRDLSDLSLQWARGGVLSGRVALDASAHRPSPLGLRVEAWPAEGQFPQARPITNSVAADGSFRLTGLFGIYRVGVRSDSESIAASRLTVDGADVPLEGFVDVRDGDHIASIVVTARRLPRSAIDPTLSALALVERFKAEPVFWRQFDLGKAIVARHDPSVVPLLADWLGQQDRHIRANVAFVVGALGDSRGLPVLTAMLSDRSDRPVGQGIAQAPSDGRYHVAAQIRADRDYAAHMLGDLRDPRAIPALVRLLNDPETRLGIPWALGQIGDSRAIAPLLDVLDQDDPSMRVLAIYALETLNAKAALPRLRTLLDDHRTTTFGAQVSVADAAQVAIMKLK